MVMGVFLLHVTTVLIRKVCKKVCNIPVYFLYLPSLPSPQFITLRLFDLRNIEQLFYIDQVCSEHEVTWPSQRSMSCVFSLWVRMSLLCSSLPSKYIQGQQCSQGIGCPHASLANRAMSTPLMNKAANWTPWRSSLSICGRGTYRLTKCPNDKKESAKFLQSPSEHLDKQRLIKAKHIESRSSPFTPSFLNTVVHNPIQSTQQASRHNLAKATHRQTTRTQAHSLCGWFRWTKAK